jgi:hypothetical protein
LRLSQFADPDKTRSNRNEPQPAGLDELLDIVGGGKAGAKI